VVNGSFETGFTIQGIESSEEEIEKNQFTFKTVSEAQNFIENLKKNPVENEKEGM
jgi:hypothetical protein